MVNLEYVLYICIAVPLLLMLILLKGRSKLLLGFMLIGITVCLFISEINSLLSPLFDQDMVYLTTVITPITEELAKMIPILFFALVFDDKRETLFMIALALGIGFGLFENTVILVQNIESVSIVWALIRGFSTALMHGICTLCVGLGISFVRKKKKLFWSGLFALLTLAAVYHGIFNMLQLENKYIGADLPIVTYIPIIVVRAKGIRYARRKKEAVDTH